MMSSKERKTNYYFRRDVLLLMSTLLMLVMMWDFFPVSRESQSGPVSISPSHDSYYGLAKHESFGFFDDIDYSTWQFHRERARGESMYIHPENPSDGLENPAIWLMHNVDPIFTCPNLRRVGGRGDGPKWVCDPHRLRTLPDCLVYSVGSGGLYLFEDGLVDLLLKSNSTRQQRQKPYPNCEIHVFDPSPDYARQSDPETKNIHYHPWGISSSYEAGAGQQNGLDFLSFPATLEKLGHVGRRIDIFKIDCEGCEWFSFKDWLDPAVDIRQILIETHHDRGQQYATAVEFFDRFLDRGFAMFSKEINTLGTICDHFFEWSFVRLHPDFFQSSAT